MIDIVSELQQKKNEVISLHEVIITLQEQSPNATLPQIAEWLLIHLVDDQDTPDFGVLGLGGSFELIPPPWVGDSEYLSLRQLLVELYRYGDHDSWPGDIPF
ncbi:hypothetical protein [Pectobacterium versatile]|uniref:hypothetical protein n=1 Tax=Pectobacterium versatile TaxID=2488639 RepID=UPI001F33580D|nr:hypothetical protein [Pectobacterium versatile]